MVTSSSYRSLPTRLSNTGDEQLRDGSIGSVVGQREVEAVRTSDGGAGGLLQPTVAGPLMEAADALCAEQARLYHAGGPALDAVVRAANGNWAAILDPEHEGWLANLLHAALCARADLVLTGRDLMRGVRRAYF